jgi:LPXTG-motif cell wall-anchored protein
MKRSVLVFTLAALLLLNFGYKVSAQDVPLPKKDTVNIDSEAKPQVYYAVEDENKGGSTTIIIIGAVVVIGAAAFFLLKKKK